jgi:hypothetical protein
VGLPVAATAVAAAVALGVLSVVGSHTDAAAAVANAVTSTLADRTAHVDLTLRAGDAGMAITATGSGSVDFSQNAMQLQTSIGADGDQVQMTLLYVDRTVYEQLPGLAQAVPGKSWVSVDLSSLADSSALGSTRATSIGQDPTVMLRLLAQQGNTVSPLGGSSVAGLPVQGYAVTISADKLRSEVANANLPSWMRQMVATAGLGGVTCDVYVDAKGLLRRETLTTAMTVGGSSLSLHERFDFSDYGTVVTVTPPPASAVIGVDQLLHQARSGVSP